MDDHLVLGRVPPTALGLGRSSLQGKAAVFNGSLHGLPTRGLVVCQATPRRPPPPDRRLDRHNRSSLCKVFHPHHGVPKADPHDVGLTSARLKLKATLFVLNWSADAGSGQSPSDPDGPAAVMPKSSATPAPSLSSSKAWGTGM